MKEKKLTLSNSEINNYVKIYGIDPVEALNEALRDYMESIDDLQEHEFQTRAKKVFQDNYSRTSTKQLENNLLLLL